MVKLKLNRVKRTICPTCKGNGYIRVAANDTPINNSEVHQCWDCDSEGEFYETIEDNDFIDDGDDSNKLH